MSRGPLWQLGEARGTPAKANVFHMHVVKTYDYKVINYIKIQHIDH